MLIEQLTRSIGIDYAIDRDTLVNDGLIPVNAEDRPHARAESSAVIGSW
jgi:hypothetical protein